MYSYLPLGLRVLKKIENIIREEMDQIGGTEMKTSILQDKEIWEKTNRWDDKEVDIWFKTKLKNGGEVGLSWSNEEDFANILKQYVGSYKDLPLYLYDFKDILRNETRSKSGILRGREFYWKALYSFSRDESEHNVFYEKMKTAYQNIFRRTGIGHMTYPTFASGGAFSKYSHEFPTITSAGEDTIYVSEDKAIAVNREVMEEEVLASLGLEKDKLMEHRAIEVGNIFTLGTSKSEALELHYADKSGEKKPVFMGSYGIGLGRLIGTVVEVLSDDKGIIWPESIAPFHFHLLAIGENETVLAEANKIYESISKVHEVLFDDRQGVSAGEKFADADLLGIPYRAVVSERSLKEGGIELKKRTEEKGRIVTIDEILKIIKSKD
ncbi:MAG: Proline-tRNA ligase [Candidatus Nomurabacteria bacterium GW2011_GWB1_43_7]|uniref:Proline--tRNA ligase n=1 Tax=Candidatus Nomurabacteria bacterium GW2011_GWB1_43_7 TaxID=1618747 RepID=A0A0G1F825_9BACT|nr:MAG: Proline-tRNA ligase [Candidatus Nomurabacteria bacterium GW2011_GWB1_43_7]